MRILLDTHSLLWAMAAPKRLPKRIAAAIRDPANQVFVSAVSTWEIAIKSAIGKIEADVSEIAAAFDEIGFVELPVTVAHTIRLREIPPHHRDPFDRLLVAQAIEGGLVLASRDPVFSGYAVDVLWN